MKAGRFFYIDLRQRPPVIDQWEPLGFADYRLETSVRTGSTKDVESGMIERMADSSTKSPAEIRHSWASSHLWWDWKYMTDDLINHMLSVDIDVYRYIWEE